MKPVNMPDGTEVLQNLCSKVRELVDKNDYEQCEKLIRNAMCAYPHAWEPHNLIGILLEMEGDHVCAMKHFRASIALNPTYEPAHHNLKLYGTFLSNGRCAFDETDCSKIESKSQNEVIHDKYGIDRSLRRSSDGNIIK